MKRNHRLGLVLSDVEKGLLIEMAKFEGYISLASYVRKLIWQAGHEKDLINPPKKSKPEQDFEGDPSK